MMVNTRIKGDTKERQAKAMFEAQGYVVEKVRKTRFFSGDYFGCADLVCMKESDIALVAVTDKSHASRGRRKLRAFRNHPPYIRKILMTYEIPKDIFKKTIWKSEIVNGDLKS